MTLHAFLLAWTWLSHHTCTVIGPGSFTHSGYTWSPMYEGRCTEAIQIAHQVGGSWSID
jgi:hypothetical protein